MTMMVMAIMMAMVLVLVMMMRRTVQVMSYGGEKDIKLLWLHTPIELERTLGFALENRTSDFSPFPSKVAALLYMMLHSQRPIVRLISSNNHYYHNLVQSDPILWRHYSGNRSKKWNKFIVWDLIIAGNNELNAHTVADPPPHAYIQDSHKRRITNWRTFTSFVAQTS